MKITKTYLLAFFAIAFISLSSCNKVKDAIQADVNITPSGDITFTIPAIPNTNEREIAGVEDISALDVSQYKGIKSIVLKSLKVELLEEKLEANFKVLEKISVEIVSGSNIALLASKTNTDHTTDQYAIEIPTDATIDIQSFVKNTFSYKIRGKAKTTTTEEVPAKISAVYTVKFGL